jgi:hypothetical protein
VFLVPYLYVDLVAKKLRRTFLPIDFKEDLFRCNRSYVACQTNDELPYILKYGTQDSLMIGTDYYEQRLVLRGEESKKRYSL